MWLHKLLLAAQHELESYPWARESSGANSDYGRMDRDRGGGGGGGGGGRLYEDRGMDEDEDQGQSSAEEKQSSLLQVHTPSIYTMSMPYQHPLLINIHILSTYPINPPHHDLDIPTNPPPFLLLFSAYPARQASTPPSSYPSSCTTIFRPGSEGGLSGEGGLLTGTTVTFDHGQPLLGHAALFRQANGSITSVNLTVHMKLCELEATMRHEETSEALQQSLSAKQSSSMESIAWERSTQQLLKQALTGLSSVPYLSENNNNNDDGGTVDAAQSSRNLVLASDHLEKNVATHLEELSRRLRYRVDILQDCYAAQLEMLDGCWDEKESSGVRS